MHFVHFLKLDNENKQFFLIFPQMFYRKKNYFVDTTAKIMIMSFFLSGTVTTIACLFLKCVNY